MSAAPARDHLIGSVVAERYQVVRAIARGGMGTIYEVKHTKLSRTFALKKLDPSLIDDAEAVERFHREADIVAGLRHPNIVQVVDWETLDDGSPCMIMEMLVGEDLAARIARGPLPWPKIVEVGDAILGALAVAHKAGIVHRDLKPANVFLARDDSGVEQVKLLDFGISKIQGGKKRLTQEKQLLGTPLYMSPEQLEGRSDDVTSAADVWAVGAMLYEMAAGVPAFDGDTVHSILYRIAQGSPDPLRKVRADTPPGFVELVQRTLEREPRARGSAAEVRLRLRDSLARGPRPRRWPLLALAVVAAGAALWQFRPRPSRLAEPAPPVVAPMKVTPLPLPPPAPGRITIVVDPPRAHLQLDGVNLDFACGVRCEVVVPRDGKPHQLRASAAGYRPEVRSIGADSPAEIQLKLHHLSPKRSAEVLDP